MNCEDPHADGLCPACREAIRDEARRFYGSPLKRPGRPDVKPPNGQAPGRWAGPQRRKTVPDTPSAPAGRITDQTGAYGVSSSTRKGV